MDLIVFAGDERVAYPLPERGRVVIGRGADCDVRIDDPSVSRRHAALHVGPPLRIEDLGSANGISVRHPRRPGEEADTHELRRRPGEVIDLALGDCILLGSTVAVVRRREAAAEAAGREVASGAAGRGDGKGPAGGGILVLDPAMTALYEDARRAARADIPVLLLGETGVGKEVLAREIHRLSPRAAGPFLAFNCAALSASLLEGELFGHEKGAFTGAQQARPGLLESASGGTVLLDEVGELPAEAQAKLLRAIGEKEVLRVGGRAPRTIDVRFIAATHRDLEAEVARGTFREDLFYRLAAVPLTIPPLRDRPAEIAPLAEAFLARACADIDRADRACADIDRAPPPVISAEARALLGRYRWPGNLRELRNAMERAAVLCGGDELLPEHLPRKIAAGPPGPPPAPSAPGDGGPAPPSGGTTLLLAPRGAAVEPIADPRDAAVSDEKRRILEALDRVAGNQTRAANILGVSRRTLLNKLDKYDLPRPRKR